jgi:hypothetical protein
MNCYHCGMSFLHVVDLEDHLKDKHRPDAVNSPSHYCTGQIEVIDFIEDQKLPYHLGNAIKYISRCQHKGKQKEDLKKAIWYIDRFIDLCED